MAMSNKLGLTDAADLAREEERISKKKAAELFESGMLDTLEPGTFTALAAIHRHLFEKIYDFAGQVRTVNIAKGNFRFAPVMYLHAALENIDRMPQGTFEEIVEKYVEMNIAHPFREGNGRSTRIWLDHMLKRETGRVVDWCAIEKDAYMRAMMRSVVDGTMLKRLICGALTDDADSREVYLRGIDRSFEYEGLAAYSVGSCEHGRRE